jgi:hypothetical protein
LNEEYFVRKEKIIDKKQRKLMTLGKKVLEMADV